jgi:signal transduction histidine kinase/CheY-like chemotaxis protein
MESELITRKSICLGQPLPPNVVIHDGDPSFSEGLGRLYPSSVESNILEELIILKSKLQQCSSDDFWSLVSERMAEILGAQMCFIAKRILVDEQDAAIEMPPLGEPGSCLMATAWYYNDGNGLQGVEKGLKYHAYGCPCGYMRHDKVFVVPEKVSEIFANNPNTLPVSAESYIGIPLFAGEKCFAHFGLLWSVEGAKKRNISWAFIEMFLHALEDLILERLLEGSNFKDTQEKSRDPPRVIPHHVITAAQSLQPYAKSLSHELRTPMQGVVGMLDVMYATVQEAAEGQTDAAVRKIFETLKENIEIVQDSSRRAVEAADNVVHAYDMNLGIPTGPLPNDDPLDDLQDGLHASHPEILVAGSNLPISRPNKRRREDLNPDPDGSPTKHRATVAARVSKMTPTEAMKQGVGEAEDLPENMPSSPRPSIASLQGDRAIAPGVRHTNLRRVLQYVVNEGLKVGGRPESAIAQETFLGEIIEVCTRSAKGEPRTKLIEWSVDPSVPETTLVDEKDLAKLISCVFLNAIKFTEQGNITVTAKLSPKSRYIVIKCTDTGPGIPAAFLPRLFQPFSQEDPSLTRQSEGLGLGLLVAKGLARKLGGDLFCIRADTSGPKRGSEFEMRIPLKAGDSAARPPPSLQTPLHNRMRQSNSLDSDGRPSPMPNFSTPHTRTRSDHSIKDLISPTEKPVIGASSTAPAVKTPPILTRTQSFPMPSFPPKQAGVSGRKSSASVTGIDRNLATKYPLNFLVAEDNKINRKLLVSMLNKFGYKSVVEAYDGAEAVRQMTKNPGVDVVLMDLWMPFMDGYEATEKILAMSHGKNGVCGDTPTVLAVTADVTDGALERAAKAGMKGFMTKPFKLMDLQRLILEYCARSGSEVESAE